MSVNQPVEEVGSYSGDAYEQRKVVPHVDWGYGDGRLVGDTSEFSVGYGVPLLYEMQSRSRQGLSYRSQVEPSLDGRLIPS